MKSHRTLIAGVVGFTSLLAVFVVRPRGETTSDAIAPKPPKREVMVALDVSGSRSSADLKADRQLVEQIIERLDPADRIVLMTVDGRTRARGNGWPFLIPEVKHYPHKSQIEQQNITDSKSDINKQVEDLFQGEQKKVETNIFGTMFTVADFRHESGGRPTTLILFSDMIQDSDKVRFDRNGGIPKTTWITEQRDGGRLPKLNGVCVSVVGADTSTAQGLAIRSFWSAYFSETGADFSADRYRQTVTDVSTLFCKELE